MPCNSRHVSRSYSKDETEKIAFEWQSLLVSAAKGGEPSTYVIEPGIILWSVQVRSLPICRNVTSMRTASSTAPPASVPPSPEPSSPCVAAIFATRYFLL